MAGDRDTVLLEFYVWGTTGSNLAVLEGFQGYTHRDFLLVCVPVVLETESVIGHMQDTVSPWPSFTVSPDWPMVFRIEATPGSVKVYQNFMGVCSEGHLMPKFKLMALHTLDMCSATWAGSLAPRLLSTLYDHEAYFPLLMPPWTYLRGTM